ncbi:MAG: ABC transporter substrate-binding protein [Actinomycetota bacterium]|nr:ABC transporter substrate-binding protein [Acidimicrobiales bacterium]MED6329770.1 ABC transporter substrate-binding protein [Actinomycetota bacterium]
MAHKILGPLLVVVIAACGGAKASSAMSGVPAAAEPAGHERIVSISTVATEMLFAIDAGDRVVAVDSMSNYPAEAPTTDLSGYQPNVEAILGFAPDLVVLSYDPGDVVAGLEAAGVATLLQGAAYTLADTYDQITALGAITGDVDEAAALVAGMQSEMAELAASVRERDEPLSYYHELDDTLYTVTSSTFIGEVYALAGLVNAADAADPDGASWGYPQLSAEYLLDADPDLIFLADTRCCSQTAVTVAERPGWETLTAVTNGTVIELDDDVASRWGPRIVHLLRVIVDSVNAIS